jgi:hypothetical protein
MRNLSRGAVIGGNRAQTAVVGGVMADLATAMREIQSVMSQPQLPVAVVVLNANGSSKEQVIDQRKLGEVLGGTPTVVGAVRSLDVQAIAKRGAKGTVNTHKLPENWETGVCGPIILFRTDESAQPKPFKLAEFKAWVDEGGDQTLFQARGAQHYEAPNHPTATLCFALRHAR